MNNKLQPGHSFSTKAEATAYMKQQHKEHSGAWTLHHHGYGSKRWEVVHLLTELQQAQVKAREDLKFYLDDFFTGAYSSIADQIKMLKTNFAEWNERFTRNPYNAFYWGDSVVNDAAEYRILTFAMEMHEEGETIEQIAAKFAERTEDLCKTQHHNSTSPIANVMAEAERIASAKFTYKLRNHVTKRNAAIATAKELGVTEEN